MKLILVKLLLVVVGFVVSLCSWRLLIGAWPGSPHPEVAGSGFDPYVWHFQQVLEAKRKSKIRNKNIFTELFGLNFKIREFKGSHKEAYDMT